MLPSKTGSQPAGFTCFLASQSVLAESNCLLSGPNGARDHVRLGLVSPLGVAPSSPRLQGGAVTGSAEETLLRDACRYRPGPGGVKNRPPHLENTRRSPRRYRTEPAHLERVVTSPEVERATEPATGIAPVRIAYGAMISLGITGSMPRRKESNPRASS